MSIVEIVKDTIISNSLIRKGDKVLAALSGGSDSVAMTDILIKLSKELEFSVCAAHVNHNIREEALHDENFVRSYCKNAGIECYVKSVDVTGYAKEHNMSSELAGRKIRYDFFEEIKQKYGITKIATAHNKNDSAESILLHLIRGCGIAGLCGIPYSREGGIIRPVLDLTKDMIEKYCNVNHLSYVSDRTNFENDYTRNKIRNIIIPKIGMINENFINTVTDNGVIFKDSLDFMTEYAKEAYEKICNEGKLDTEKLLKEHIAIIRLIIQMHYENFAKSSQNLSVDYIDMIIEPISRGKTSKTVNLPGGISARIEYNGLYFIKTYNNKEEYEIPVDMEKAVKIPGTDREIIIKEEKSIDKSCKNKIYFYINKEDKLYIRNRRKGDYFFPVGMTGRKKLSDLFCDMKIPAGERDNIALLTDKNSIIWVTGIRADRRFLQGDVLMSAQITERRKD